MNSLVFVNDDTLKCLMSTCTPKKMHYFKFTIDGHFHMSVVQYDGQNYKQITSGFYSDSGTYVITYVPVYDAPVFLRFTTGRRNDWSIMKGIEIRT